MKKFIKGKWFPVAILVIIVVALLIFLGCIGFRITYNPALENSWEAVSAVAAWVGIVMSFAAIMTAIWTPIRIANRQDKIELFGKRMECYIIIQNIFAFARQISNAKNKKDIQTAFKLYFGTADSFGENQHYTWYAITLKRQEPIIIGGYFLFSKFYDEKILQNLLLEIIKLSRLIAVDNEEDAEQSISDETENSKESICKVCSKLELDLIPQIEEDLKLCKR